MKLVETDAIVDLNELTHQVLPAIQLRWFDRDRLILK
jgi:hypothetical protein